MTPVNKAPFLDVEALDRAFALDDATKTARNNLLADLTRVNSAEELWEAYRAATMPAHASAVQLAETKRAIFWAVSSMAMLVADPERFTNIVKGVQEHALAELRVRAGGGS